MFFNKRDKIVFKPIFKNSKTTDFENFSNLQGNCFDWAMDLFIVKIFRVEKFSKSSKLNEIGKISRVIFR